MMSGGRWGFTTRASCLMAAGVTALVCGVALDVVDLARAGVLVLAVPVLSALVVLRSRVLIGNRRRVDPARSVAGETVVVGLTITNRSLLRTGSLMLEDQLPGQLHGRARFVLDGLTSRESRTVSYRMPRLPRGRYRAGPLHIRLTDPFHLVDVRRSFTTTSEIVVAPVVEPLRHIDPPRSIDVGDDAGSHSIGVRGADDASTREFRTGDDLRKIHWRSSARTGALMVRQEERPWQGQLTLLLDLRSHAHVTGPELEAGSDERLRSSLEWAISAIASIGSHAIVGGRPVALLSDQSAAVPLHLADPGRLSEHLASVRASPRPDLTGTGGGLRAMSRESTVVAVLGEVDPLSLRTLAAVHPRGSTSAALALLLDTGTWATGPGSPPSPPEAPCYAAARALRAAGWQAAVVRCGDSVSQAWQTLLGPRTAAALAGTSRR